METIKDTQPDTELMIGSDKVVFEGDLVVIHATEPMDWRLREFCKVPIWFRDQKYFLQSKRTGQPPRGVIYELAPWPENLHEVSPDSICYDEEFVIERNRLNGSVRRHDRFNPILLPFYPFLGLAWSDFKNGTLARCGFDPQSITSASVFLVFCVFTLQGVFVGRFRAGLLTQFFGSGFMIYDLGLLLLLGLDILVRYVSLLKGETDRFLGFCQWLVPKLSKER
jgi:hypothetical protein